MGKVFLSYSHNDRDFVGELYRRLLRDGVDCFFDKTSIAWGANFVIELELGIDTCDQIVLILSPDYFKSEWAKIERTSAMTDLSKKLLPLLLKPCDTPLPRFLTTIQSIDISSDTKFDSEYPRICRELGGLFRLKYSNLGWRDASISIHGLKPMAGKDLTG